MNRSDPLFEGHSNETDDMIDAENPYGRKPLSAGIVDLDWTEFMHYLYLPVAMIGSSDVRLPARLEFLRPTVEQVIWNEGVDGDRYVYVTARRGYASPGNPLNRPGWHCDGFGTDDVNYIWTDRFPTLFAEHPFRSIAADHVRSAEQFDEQVREGHLVEYPTKTLLRLDPFVVHGTPTIPAPGGERSFLKVSVSRHRYNLVGNSHNYRFVYEWQMFTRAEVRNDPAYAGGDFLPDRSEA